MEYEKCESVLAGYTCEYVSDCVSQCVCYLRMDCRRALPGRFALALFLARPLPAPPAAPPAPRPPALRPPPPPPAPRPPPRPPAAPPRPLPLLLRRYPLMSAADSAVLRFSRLPPNPYLASFFCRLLFPLPDLHTFHWSLYSLLLSFSYSSPSRFLFRDGILVPSLVRSTVSPNASSPSLM